MSTMFFKVYGWTVIRPIRWLFWKMVCNSYPRFIPERSEWNNKWRIPNIHWWLLYITIFKFCAWLYWDTWRLFCNWEGGYRRTFPISARIVKRVGATTAGYAIGGGQCYHCGSEKGDPVELADDNTGKTFKLLKTWTESTMDGTDFRFRGITICPKCGYEAEYEDGSL